jgi:hypothetical protein
VTDTITATHLAQARALVEQAAAGQPVLYAPSVLDEAADLLGKMWSVEEHTGARFEPRVLLGDFPVHALENVLGQHTALNQAANRKLQDIHALEASLLTALGEAGVKADRGPSIFLRAHRTPSTPAGDRDGFLLGIYADAVWFIETSVANDPCVPIVAPATPAGAVEVAGVVRAFLDGRLGNPFAR